MAGKLKKAICPICNKKIFRHDNARYIMTLPVTSTLTPPKLTCHLACVQNERNTKTNK